MYVYLIFPVVLNYGILHITERVHMSVLHVDIATRGISYGYLTDVNSTGSAELAKADYQSGQVRPVTKIVIATPISINDYFTMTASLGHATYTAAFTLATGVENVRLRRYCDKG